MNSKKTFGLCLIMGINLWAIDVNSESCKIPLNMQNKLTNKNYTVEELKSHPDYISSKKLRSDHRPEEIKEAISQMSDNLRSRYIVAEMDTFDVASGKCKGVEEIMPDLNKISDFKNLIRYAKRERLIPNTRTLTHKSLEIFRNIGVPSQLSEELSAMRSYLSLMDNVDKQDIYSKEVMLKDGEPVAIKRAPMIGGKCYGQTMSLCEIKNGKPTLVAKFAMSGVKRSMFFYIPEVYYSKHNYINTRRWELNRPYTKDDELRDQKLGGGSDQVAYYRGTTAMDNFMNFLPAKGHPGQQYANGIHERVLGWNSTQLLGSAASAGCLRLNDYGAKFVRWWAPAGANLFIDYSVKGWK